MDFRVSFNREAPVNQSFPLQAAPSKKNLSDRIKGLGNQMFSQVRSVVPISIQVTNKTNENEVVLKGKLFAIPKEKEMNKSEKKAIEDRELVPVLTSELSELTRGSVARGELEVHDKDIVYVRVNDLMKCFNVKPKEQTAILKLLKNESNVSEHVLAKAVRRRLDDALLGRVSNTRLYDSYKKFSEVPVDEETHKKANALASSAKRLSPDELNQLSKERDFIKNRTSGSLTLSATGESTSSEMAVKRNENWVAADNYGRVLAQSGTPMSVEIVCDFNRSLYHGMKDEEEAAGKLRDAPTTLGVIYVHQDHVKSEMENTIDWINTQLAAWKKGEANIIEIAALAYQKIVSIHPFEDGNGRTARLVMDYILQVGGLPPASLGKNVDVGIFGEQKPPNQPEDFSVTSINSTPTKAVELVIQGVEDSLKFIEAQRAKSSSKEYIENSNEGG